MKKYIKISNQGLLNIKLMTLMGGTTKENQPEKIGFFGTGGKYLMSYMARNDLSLRLFVGKKEVKIEAKPENVGGVDFKIIHIDGKETSITDKMGRDWKPWYILREVWSNALDEGKPKRSLVSNVSGVENRTTFFLEADVEFLNVWNNWTKYFIQDLEPLHVQDGFKLYSGNSDTLKIYKQGVLVSEKKVDGGSIFSYDIDKCNINELRELLDTADALIYKTVTQLDSKKMVTYFLENCNEKVYEGGMDYDWGWYKGFNETWKDAIGNAKLIHKEALDKIKAREVNIDTTGTIVIAKGLYKALTKKFEGIGALRVANKNNEFFEYLEPELELKIKQALTILEQCDYWVHPELKFIFGEFGNKTTMAEVSLDKKEILISNKFMQKSLFSIIAMLIEENEHFNTGLNDETRAFQQHFIDLFTQTLLAKHEIKI